MLRLGECTWSWGVRWILGDSHRWLHLHHEGQNYPWGQCSLTHLRLFHAIKYSNNLKDKSQWRVPTLSWLSPPMALFCLLLSMVLLCLVLFQWVQQFLLPNHSLTYQRSKFLVGTISTTGEKEFFSTLDMHGVAFTLTDSKLEANADVKILDNWTYANKVCRYTILQTLSNELFDVYL